MKINGFGKRFLSLLLAVVALVGLLSVGAMAEGTAPSVTLKVVNTTTSPIAGQPVVAYVYLAGVPSGTSVQGITFKLDCPEGFYLANVDEEDNKSEDMTSELSVAKGTNVVGNNGTTMTYFYSTTSAKNVVGSDDGSDILVSKVTIQTPATVYGNVSIGISASNLNVANDECQFEVATSSASLTFPSVKLTFVSSKEGTTPEAQEMAEGANPTEPSAPTFPGYTFGGWYTDEGCADDTRFDFTESMKENATVYAKWTANQTVVTFDVNGGTALSDAQKTKTVTYGGTYGELPKPSYAGYVFQGWFTAAEGGTPIGADTQIPSDLAGTQTLYAQWGPKKTIEYDETVQEKTYNGTPQSFELKHTPAYAPKPGVSVQYSEKGKNNFSTSAPSVAGEYDVKLTANEDDTYKKLDRTITGGLVIEKAEIAKPTLTQDTFTYDSTDHTVSLNASDDSGKYTLNADTATAKTVGTHDAEVTLNEEYRANYKWAGESDDTVTIKLRYTIEPQKITAPTADTTVYTYTGENQTYQLTLDEDSMKLADDSDELTQKNAGAYTIKVALKDRVNTSWLDGSTADKEYTFTIAKKTLEKPTAKTTTTSFTYNDAKQKLELNTTSDLYTLSDNEQKDVGNYNAKVTLTDPDNYCWKDETGASFLIPFSIVKADQTAPTGLTADAESIYKKGDGKLKGLEKNRMEYKLKGATTDYITADAANISDLAAGTYLVRYKADANHNASPNTEVTIDEGRKLKVEFFSAGEDVDPQDGLAYKDPITKPEAVYTGFKLVGWYKEMECRNAWDFATDRVEDDTTLYAKLEVSIGIEGGASFTEGKAPAEGVKIIVGKGLDQTETQTLDLKRVTVAGKKLDAENYTAVYDKNGLTITLKQDYLNTLGDDEYRVGVVVDSEHLGDGRNLGVTLTVEPEQVEAGKPAGKPGKAVKTGDSSDLLLWSILSLGAGAGLVCIGKKRREN